MDDKTDKFVDFILNWWNKERREFPWRKTSDPYIILVTEILLRKTTADQVNSVFDTFFNKYPKIIDLAHANKKELLEILTPLGMENKRTEELVKLANSILNDYQGNVPNSCSSLMELYGVGKYTAAGVMCIAYKKDEAMVDRNVVRVMKRYFGFKSKRKRERDDPELWKFVKNMIPKGKCKEFNLGLIDFAGAVCTARSPKCDLCGINELCMDK